MARGPTLRSPGNRLDRRLGSSARREPLAVAADPSILQGGVQGGVADATLRQRFRPRQHSRRPTGQNPPVGPAGRTGSCASSESIRRATLSSSPSSTPSRPRCRRLKSFRNGSGRRTRRPLCGPPASLVRRSRFGTSTGMAPAWTQRRGRRHPSSGPCFGAPRGAAQLRRLRARTRPSPPATSARRRARVR